MKKSLEFHLKLGIFIAIRKMWIITDRPTRILLVITIIWVNNVTARR